MQLTIQITDETPKITSKPK